MAAISERVAAARRCLREFSVSKVGFCHLDLTAEEPTFVGRDGNICRLCYCLWVLRHLLRKKEVGNVTSWVCYYVTGQFFIHTVVFSAASLSPGRRSRGREQ